MSKYKVLKDNLKSLVGEEFEKTLPIIAGDYEDKIKRQAAEITRLLAENEYLKKIKTKDIEHLCDVCTKQGVIEEARAEGAEAAWDLARKIMLSTNYGGYSTEELNKIFDNKLPYNILANYTYPEAAAKVTEWEKTKEEIKVGDIYRGKTGNFVICSIFHEKNTVRILWDDSSAGTRRIDEIKKDYVKTGRHIDIEGLLKQIGEE